MTNSKQRVPNQKKLVTTGLVVFALFLIVLIFSNATFLTIDPGERGVLFRRFAGGLDTERVYNPGFHIIAPWNIMYVYDVREQQLDEEMEVLSSNGLNISIDVTVRVNPQYDKIGNLHEKFGDNMDVAIRYTDSISQTQNNKTPLFIQNMEIL